MISPDPQKINQFISKRELSATFLRNGLVTFFIGSFDILVGLYIKQSLNAQPFFTILPLLVSLPIVMVVNWYSIHLALRSIQARSGKK